MLGKTGRLLFHRGGGPSPSTAAELYHLQVDLHSLAEYADLQRSQPRYFSSACEQTILRHVQTHGVESAFLGRIPPERVQVIGDEPREHLMCDGLSSRARAVLDAVLEYTAEHSLPDRDVKIYGHEAVTRFALALRGRFPKFIGTEFCRSERERAALFPIRHGDAMHSEFPDGSFHLVVSCDVMEHVPDLDACLRDTARILRPGGRLIATLPLFHDRETGLRFATLQPDGEIAYHLPPIYHGNPMDEAGGALVFEIPGWDLVQRARSAGFARATLRFICDQNRGIVAAHHLPAGRAGSAPKGVFVALFDKG